MTQMRCFGPIGGYADEQGQAAGICAIGGGYALTHVIDDHGYMVLGEHRGVTLAEVDAYLDGGYAEHDAERYPPAIEVERRDVKACGGDLRRVNGSGLT
jgi:hypothetical protein